MLLHWAHLSPEAGTDLAAVRFNSPVRISSVRIFPHGYKPFLQDSSIVSETKPDSFYLDVYLTAHPNSNVVKDKEKPARPPNTLAASKIAYAGRLTDYHISLGEEFVTRLMIFKGAFEKLTLAIYGFSVASTSTVVTDQTMTVSSPIATSSTRAVPLTLDPAVARDPTGLAVKLLTLIPKTVPSLSLITRLMLCVKATDDMWEDPRFPFIYSQLNGSQDELDVPHALEIVERQLPDDIPSSTVERFAEKVVQCFSASGSPYQLCRFLSDLASQPISIVQTVLEYLDVASLLDPHALDERSFTLLVEAATNPAIARILDTPYFTEALQGLATSRSRSASTQPAADALFRRIQASLAFEDCLTNPDGDFKTAVLFMKELGRQEICLGTWLISIITHPDYSVKMNSPAQDCSYVPNLFEHHHTILHEEFVAFTKSFIGVASNLVILAWADSWGDDACIERIVAVLRLWQTVNGYREIVNHLLLMSQFTYRIEWITSDNDPPRQSGIIAEQLLSDLATDPRNLVDPANHALVQSILSLKQPLSHLSENDRLLLRKLALVAEDGLPAAIEEIAYSSDRPLSLRRLHTLRLAATIVLQHLQQGKAYKVLQALWDEKQHGLLTLLIELLIAVAEDLKVHMATKNIQCADQALLEQLFLLSQDLIKSVDAMVLTYPPAGRTLRSLASALAEVFILAHFTNQSLPSSSDPCLAAQRASMICIGSIRRLCQPGLQSGQGKPGVEVALSALLDHGSTRTIQGLDPTKQASLMAHLIDQAVSSSGTGSELEKDVQEWTCAIFPDILPQLEAFLGVLQPEEKADFLKNIARIDGAVTGTAEYLLSQELHRINDALAHLPDPNGTPHSNIMGYRASILLRFLEALLETDTWASWCISNNVEVSSTMSSILETIFTRNISSRAIPPIITSLTSSANPLPEGLLIHLLLLTIRQSPSHCLLVPSILGIAKSLDSNHLRTPQVQQAMGSMLLQLLVQSSTAVDQSTLAAMRDILLYLSGSHGDMGYPLPGFTSLDGDMLFDQLSVDLSGVDLESLVDAKARLVFDEDLPKVPPRYVLPEELRMSTQDLEASLPRVYTSESSKTLTPPATPKKPSTPEIMSLVTASPPTTLFHSPVASTTGLTKTYLNNDFRELRQLPSSRQTTSGRHPSVHVDVS